MAGSAPLEEFLYREARNRLQRQYLLPTIVLLLSALCVLTSLFFPYWEMEMEAPQYPKGLSVQVFIHGVSGDVDEVDGLNHYIGMKPLKDAGILERTLGVYALVATALAVMGAVFIHNKWAGLFILPVASLPIGFLVDLGFWLNLFGQNLDPTAALSSSVQPFTPPILGTNVIANFVVIGSLELGFFMTCAGAGLALAGIYLHRKTYKPLVAETQDAYHNRVATISNVDSVELSKALKAARN